tara:strand:- start:82 stop:273 length:192 start_codon:yes stop_codon:yes gene_type:complete
MTKKDYIKFATLLKNMKANIYKDNNDDYNFVLNFNDVYSGMIEIFKSDNNRFDENSFKKFIRK